MYATPILSGKVVRFRLPPALAKAHKWNVGKTMTNQQAVEFVEAKRRNWLSAGPSPTLKAVLDTCILKLATLPNPTNYSALIVSLWWEGLVECSAAPAMLEESLLTNRNCLAWFRSDCKFVTP